MSQRSVLLWILVPIGVIAVWALSMMGPASPSAVPAATAGDDERVVVEPSLPEPPATVVASKPLPKAPPLPAAAPAAPIAAPAAVEPPPPSPPEPASDDDQPEREPGKPNPSALFSAAFLEEPRDSTWAPEAENQIQAAYAKANVPFGSVLAVQCRSTLCKVDLLFDRQHHLRFAVASRELRNTFFAEDISIDRQSAPTNNGTERMTAYMPRKGRTIRDYQ
jgi:hypothetical protein